MAERRKIVLDRFDIGLATDPSATEIPAAAARRLEFADVRNKDMGKLPGTAAYNPSGLPAGIVVLSQEKFVFTIPSEQEVYLIHGTVSGAQRLYARPYLSSAGVWVDSWLHLTEAELSLTADAGTTTTTIIDAGLASTVDDYYNGWIVHNTTRHGSAIVIDYVGATKTLTLSWAIFEQASGDSFRIMRNPVYDKDGNYLFAPDSVCRFQKVRESIIIATGSDEKPTASPYRSDLLLQVINNGQFFDDTDLNFTGFYLTKNNLDHFTVSDNKLLVFNSTSIIDFPQVSAVLSNAVLSGATALPVGRYALSIVPVYDGIQESTIEPGGPGTLASESFIGLLFPEVNIIDIVASRKLQVDLSIFAGLSTSLARGPITTQAGTNTLTVVDLGTPSGTAFLDIGLVWENTTLGLQSLITGDDGAGTWALQTAIPGQTSGQTGRILSRRDIPLKMIQKNVQPRNDHIVFDRRVSHLRIYIEVAVGYKVSGGWRFVKEVPINNAAWSGSGPNYTQTVFIDGDDYDASTTAVLIADRINHDSINIQANAKFVAATRAQIFYADIHVDEKRSSFIFATPINSDGIDAFSVIPHAGASIDTRLYGMDKIVGIVEALGFLVVIGSDRVLRIDKTSLQASLNKQQRGGSSSNGVVSVNDLVYFAALEDIYFYHAAQEVVRGMLFGRIRNEWQALSIANRQAAAIGYDRRYEMLVIAAGSTIYTYNLPKVLADSLAADAAAIGAWHKYPVNYTFVRFFTDPNGACIGITNDGQVRELLSDNPTDNTQLIYESPVIEGPLAIDEMRFNYQTPAVATVELFDVARSATYPLKKFKIPPQSALSKYSATDKAKMQADLFQFRLTGPSGGKTTERFASITINPDALDEDTILKR